MNRRHFLRAAAGVSLVTVGRRGALADTDKNPKSVKNGPKTIAIDLRGGVKMDFVLVPAGSFTMGDDSGLADERPAHEVRITVPFYVGKYEVTQEQWQAVMGDNPSWFKGPKHPVDQVSWVDCQAFLGELNKKYGSPGARFSLPTEAQWEYACRAGSTSRWCFGDEESNLGEYAWHSRNSDAKTHPVGEKKPNAWGLFDMHGNVWEWSEDWYGSYANSPPDNPTGPVGGSDRVIRGGGWGSGAVFCRSACRTLHGSGHGLHALGLRVCRVVAGE
jgi:formylglycine-generating enzyme required for sulfatase activity